MKTRKLGPTHFWTKFKHKFSLLECYVFRMGAYLYRGGARRNIRNNYQLLAHTIKMLHFVCNDLILDALITGLFKRFGGYLSSLSRIL